jgi:hypothetical protein
MVCSFTSAPNAVGGALMAMTSAYAPVGQAAGTVPNIGHEATRDETLFRGGRGPEAVHRQPSTAAPAFGCALSLGC